MEVYWDDRARVQGLLLRPMKQDAEACDSYEQACKWGFKEVERMWEVFKNAPSRDPRLSLANALHKYTVSLRWCGRAQEVDEAHKESIKLGYRPMGLVGDDELELETGEEVDYHSEDDKDNSSAGESHDNWADCFDWLDDDNDNNDWYRFLELEDDAPVESMEST